MTARRLDALVVAAAAAAPGLAFDRAFPLAVLGPAVAVAALLPVLSERRAVRLAVFGAGLALLFPVLRSGLVGLLAVTLPAPVRVDLLAVPVLLTLAGSAGGAVLAARLPVSARLAVPAPTAPAWVYAALLGPFTRLDGALVAVATLVVAAQLVRSAGAGARAALGAAATLAAVAVAVLLAVPVALGAAGPRPRRDPRAALGTVGLPPSAANPLDWVDAWLTDPDRLLFTAQTSRPVDRWRLAVLPGYDGRQWTPPARYTRAGLGVPPGDPATAEPVTQTVTIASLGGPFLPAADRPARIAAPVAAVDTASGVLLADPAARPGLRYTVTSAPPRPPADPGCAPGSPQPVPAELEAPLDALIAGACPGSFAAFAATVQARLNAGRTNVARTPARGTSTGAVLRFLTPGATGTVVEFAAAFALAARRAGLETRLVVGFTGPPAPSTATTYGVHGRDVRLWVDARAPGGAWLAYQPAPPPAVAPETVTAPPPPTASEPPPPPPPTSTVDGPPPDAIGPASRPRVRWWVPPLAATGATVAAWIAYRAGIGLARAARRARRRHCGSPRHRGLAAWHDTLDALARRPAADLDPALLHTATPASSAGLLRSRCPGLEPEIARLTATAGRCLFTERDPGPAAVAEAWRAAARIRRALRRKP
ncbi:DUF3488 domain-containing protein [Dactylosporangium matsuzakiense]|uniref:DUF3488 domain-containing protein n=1 Tax=Dactylosporangium matsuzakiense TaxID=53360 RepID=UPI0021C33DBA|nr:DUF3488 domain-containing protein [Dactylosporangium matsuzakiense]UWZ48388.1 hypothetical protein Dmats_19440 [Dactylosporangium matsuzakiense]